MRLRCIRVGWRIIDKVFLNLNRRLMDMNNANVIAIVRGFRAGVLFVMVGSMLRCAQADPKSGSNELRWAAPTARDSEEDG
jgi:hypothetical protein